MPYVPSIPGFIKKFSGTTSLKNKTKAGGLGLDTADGTVLKYNGAGVIRSLRTSTASTTISGASLHAGVLSWQNPEATPIIVTKAVLYTTTVATGACTVDIGTTATSATTASDTLIDGLDVNAATGAFDNITDKGTNGKSRQLLASGKWVTIKEASGDATGLVGTLYVEYIKV